MDTVVNPPLAPFSHSEAAREPSRRGCGDGRSTWAALALALVVGVAWGAATSGLQSVLPAPWGALANSVTPWVLPSFLVGAVARRWPVAVLAGAVACLGEVAGYYSLSSVRGFGVGTGWVVLWSATAVVGGPVFGLAGWVWRCGPSGRWRWPALGAASVAAAFLAEALGYQVYLGYTGEAVLFSVLGVLAGLALGATASREPGGTPHLLRGMAGTAAWLLVALPAGVLGEIAMRAVLG